jgi:CheY-like chemotaxis protein
VSRWALAPLADIGTGDYVMLSIADTGVGMHEDVKRHIFEPFFTTKARGKGSGLGLATSYGIVRQSGGTITFESEAGRGTTFRIYLPRTHEALAGRSVTDIKALPRGHETILVVEDEAAVRSFTIKSLRHLGYTILEASNGPEAICLARDFGGTIDLLLTDMIMPQMSGKNVADEVQILRPAIKVLFSSGYTEGMIVHDGVLDSDVFFLQKPYTSATLAHMVRKVLDSVTSSNIKQ